MYSNVQLHLQDAKKISSGLIGICGMFSDSWLELVMVGRAIELTSDGRSCIQ